MQSKRRKNKNKRRRWSSRRRKEKGMVRLMEIRMTMISLMFSVSPDNAIFWVSLFVQFDYIQEKNPVDYKLF